MAGHGRAVLRPFPVFAEAFDEAPTALDAHLRLPLREVMWGADAGAVAEHGVAQPALFAVEVALAELWQSWGVAPDVVIGSFGGRDHRRACGRRVVAGGCGASGGGAGPADGAVAGRRGDGRGGRQRGRGGAAAERRCNIAAVNGPQRWWFRARRRAVDRSGGSAGATRPAGAPAGGVARLSLGADRPHARPTSAQPLAGDSAACPADRVGVQPDRAIGRTPGSGRRSIGSSTCGSRCILPTACAPPSRWGPRFRGVGPGRGLDRRRGAVVDHRAGGYRWSRWPKTGRETESLLSAAGAAVRRGVGVDWRAVFAGWVPRVELPTYAFHAATVLVARRVRSGSGNVGGVGSGRGRAWVVGCGGGAARFGWGGVDRAVIVGRAAVVGRSRRRRGGVVSRARGSWSWCCGPATRSAARWSRS